MRRPLSSAHRRYRSVAQEILVLVQTRDDVYGGGLNDDESGIVLLVSIQADFKSFPEELSGMPVAIQRIPAPEPQLA
jgi:hypothetical protein